MSTLERVSSVVCSELGLSSGLSPDSTLGSLDADSLEIASIVMALEDEFSVDLPSDEFGRLSTLKDLVSYLDSTGN